MPVTVYPTGQDAEGIKDVRGVDWKVQGGGTLQVIDQSLSPVAEWAAGQWVRVEKS